MNLSLVFIFIFRGGLTLLGVLTAVEGEILFVIILKILLEAGFLFFCKGK